MPWVVVGASVQTAVVLEQKIDVVKDVAVPLDLALLLFSLKTNNRAKTSKFCSFKLSFKYLTPAFINLARLKVPSSS